LRAAEARVSAAAAEVELANIGLSKTELRAPCHGRVLAIHGEPGEYSGPQASLPLVVFSDTSKIRVRAYVEELDAPRVKVGTQTTVTADGLPNQSFMGHVVAISPRMANKTVHSDHPSELYDTKIREVMLELSNAAQLIVGLRVDVQFNADLHGEKAPGA
jgi:HlyD family secretion protein